MRWGSYCGGEPHSLSLCPHLYYSAARRGPTSQFNGWTPPIRVDQGPDLVVGPSQEEIN
jgi:hypothetical protein